MALHHRAWRDDRADPSACFYRSLVVLGRRGPLEAWRFLQSVGPLEDAPDSIRSDWLATHACTLARLRDFDAAESWLARADRISTNRAWLLVERADVYELEDRYDDALAAAREALAHKPWYRPAVQTVARLLELLDRQPEAVELLAEASERIESAMLLAQQGALEDDLGRHADARRTWDRLVSTAPLIERRIKRWLRASAATQPTDAEIFPRPRPSPKRAVNRSSWRSPAGSKTPKSAAVASSSMSASFASTIKPALPPLLRPSRS